MKYRTSAAGFFGRTLLIITMLVLQAAFLIYALLSIGGNFFAIYGAAVVLDVILAVFIINGSEPSAYKLTWLVTISIFPLIGGAGYIFIHISKRFPRSVERTYRRRSVGLLVQEQSAARELLCASPEFFGLAKYVAEYGGYPVCRNASAEYYPLGELWYDGLLNELENAEKFIFMEYFIVREGVMFGKISDILLKKAASGVDVRLLYDGIGTGMTDCSTLIGKLGEGGVICREFNPFRPFLSSVQNNRDHRKIVVVDGRVAFSGGTNLSDEYINLTDRFGHWKDTAFRLEGEAVRNYTVMFLQLWDSVSNAEECAEYISTVECEQSIDGFVQPFSDSPLDDETVGRQVYLELICKAQDSVCIMTPYFIPDEELLSALVFAAKRGVDVRLITPHIPDKRCVHIITRSFFPRLVKAGVKVFEYTPGFIHAKCCISDGRAAVIGTINCDYRSFYMHFETAAIFYGSSIIAEMRRDFDKTAALSQLVTADDCARRSLAERLAGSLLCLFSPLF